MTAQSGNPAETINRERLAQLEHALERAMPGGGAGRTAVHIRAWHGEPFSGFFVRLDASTWALHVSRGRYVWLDIERDLSGLLPPEALRQMLPRR
jgi:hypothetical protein